jgi:hypothetical protein
MSEARTTNIARAFVAFCRVFLSLVVGQPEDVSAATVVAAARPDEAEVGKTVEVFETEGIDWWRCAFGTTG